MLNRGATNAPRFPRRQPARGAAIILGLASLLAGCRDAATALGSSPAAARANGEALAYSAAARFTNVVRAPKFLAARMKLSRHALSPSGVYTDTSVWSTPLPADSARTLILSSELVGDRYTFTTRASPPALDDVSDGRHVIRLRRLEDSEYEWWTSVDHAIGSVRAAEVARLITAMIGAAEGRAQAHLRADYRQNFPRSTRVFGTLFTLDSLRAIPQPERTTLVTLGIRLQPDRMQAGYPNFAKYLEKYVTAARYRMTLRDARGSVFFDSDANDNLIRVRFRARDGALVPLSGPARPMPDSLELRIDFFAKFLVFTVGVSNLVADFSLLRDEHLRGWLLRFRREPNWHLPLAVRHLIKTPLRRPFERGGSVLRFTVRDSTGTQTLFNRHFAMALRESAVVRWLGGLGSSAMSEFAGKAEAEENRYLAECFTALRDDLRELLGGEAGGAK